MQQIVCPKCKARVDASLNFCPGCGSALPLPNSRGGNSGEKLTQVNQQHLANAILNEGKKKENPKVSLAVGVITAVLVIGVIAYLIISAGGSSSATPTVTDSINASNVESSNQIPESSDSAIVPTTESSQESTSENSSENSTEVSEENPEESMAEPVASEVVITAEKPDDWSDIYVYVYTDDMFKNANWPGEIMTANGDGTYSYAISSSFADKNTFLVFSTSQLNKGAKLSKQFPYMSDNGYSLSEKNTFTVSDFETYANEKAKK